MTDTQAIGLIPGTSYWFDFVSTKDGRDRKLKIAMTVVDVDGRLMGETFNGTRTELPEQIIGVHKMNAFQCLRWKSRCYKSAGDQDASHQFMVAAYFAMDKWFYLERIEHVTRIWGGKSDPLLQEYVDELCRFRPDISVDQLTFVKEQNAKRIAQRERDAEDASMVEPERAPSALERFTSGVAKMLFGLRA